MRFFTCPSCDQIIVKVSEQNNPIHCCNQITESLLPNSSEQLDDHEIKVRKTGNFIKITVGNNHPMIAIHHIAAIYLETNLGFQFKHIKNQSTADANFILANDETIINVYAYCNVHQLFSLD